MKIFEGEKILSKASTVHEASQYHAGLGYIVHSEVENADGITGV